MITKLLNNKFQLLLFCLLFSLSSTSQSYTPPTEERVSELLDQIEECKSNISELSERIKFMEANASSYTLAQYNEVKALLNDSKKCVASAREELEKLRKEYPGWFNSPSATVSTRNHDFTSPRELLELLDQIQREIDEVLDGFADLIEPEH